MYVCLFVCVCARTCGEQIIQLLTISSKHWMVPSEASTINSDRLSTRVWALVLSRNRDKSENRGQDFYLFSLIPAMLCDSLNGFNHAHPANKRDKHTITHTWCCLPEGWGRGVCMPVQQHLWLQHRRTRQAAASSSPHTQSLPHWTRMQSHRTVLPPEPLRACETTILLIKSEMVQILLVKIDKHKTLSRKFSKSSVEHVILKYMMDI